MMKNILNALYFDFDGVLVDSNPIKNDAFRELFAPYGPDIVEKVLRYHQMHGGISRVEKIRLAYNEYISEPITERELAEKAEIYSSLVMEKVVNAPWIKGAQECLDKMKGFCRIFLISGTPHDELKTVIEQRGMTHYFDEILGSPIYKPDHISYLQNKYNVPSSHSLFIGDASTDYNAARMHNIPFVGIQGDYHFPANVTVLRDCTTLPDYIETHFLP